MRPALATALKAVDEGTETGTPKAARELIGAAGSPSPTSPEEPVARPERSGLSLVPAMTALFSGAYRPSSM
jgi:hypothetical protein